jgi:hypothetical protein
MRKLFRPLLVLVMMAAGLVASCGDKKGDTSSGGGKATPSATASTTGTATPSKVTLDASSDFRCSSNWGGRDGAWGLDAYSGSGSCQASFPGASGTYRISVFIQTERDGSPAYRVSINGRTVASGSYPYSSGKLACECSFDDCPDRDDVLDIGSHQLKTGDIVEFWGADDYPCGKDHGAYAKWHRMEFAPG